MTSLCKRLFYRSSRDKLALKGKAKTENGSDGYLLGLKMEDMEKELDARSEVIGTILSYLELEGTSVDIQIVVSYMMYIMQSKLAPCLTPKYH